MNKFNFNKEQLGDSLIKLAILSSALYFFSFLANIPRVESFVVFTVLLLVIAIYMFFIEKREVVIEKYLLDVAVIFLGMAVMSIITYFDYFVLGQS